MPSFVHPPAQGCGAGGGGGGGTSHGSPHGAGGAIEIGGCCFLGGIIAFLR